MSEWTKTGLAIGKPENHGKPWTVEDMWDLATLWDMPRTIESIARQVGRTEKACHVRMYIVRLAFDLQGVMKYKYAKKLMKSLADKAVRKIPHREVTS